MLCAGPGNTSGDDLAALGCKISEVFGFFVIDFKAAVRTKAANFSSMVIVSFFLRGTKTF